MDTFTIIINERQRAYLETLLNEAEQFRLNQYLYDNNIQDSFDQEDLRFLARMMAVSTDEHDTGLRAGDVINGLSL